jgi:hypothetical protein
VNLLHRKLLLTILVFEGAGEEEDDEDEEGKDTKKPKDEEEDDSGGGGEDEDEFDFMLPSWEANELLRKKATEAGLIRPFLILLSMDVRQRLKVAASLQMYFPEMDCFGDPHAEAWAILATPFKGLQDRATEYNEKINKRDRKANWYEIVYRVFDKAFDEGVRSNVVPRETCMGGFSDYGDSFKPTIGANSLYLCLDSLDDTQLRQLETGFSEKVAAAQKEGIMNDMFEFATLKEGDQSRAMQACQMQALEVVAIERKEGEPNVDEIVQDALNQTTSEGMTEEQKQSIKDKMQAKASAAVAEAAKMKAAAQASAAMWKQMQPYLDMASGGMAGMALKAWAASALIAKVATIVMRMRYCSTVGSCLGALNQIIIHAREFEKNELAGKRVNSLYDSCLLHCVECERRENVKKGEHWPNTDNGSRWMFSLEKGYMGIQRWQMQHVVCAEGLMATYDQTIVEVNGDTNPKPIKSFPVIPATCIMDAKEKVEHDEANPKLRSTMGALGIMAGSKMKGGAMAKRLELMKAVASVPLPAVFAMCHTCGYASPLSKAPSAGDLLANAEEGDRRTLIVEPKMSEDGETELPVKLKLTKHSVHTQRTDGKRSKTDLYSRIHEHSAFIDNGNKKVRSTTRHLHRSARHHL